MGERDHAEQDVTIRMNIASVLIGTGWVENFYDLDAM
jgi:hypothetical protein